MDIINLNMFILSPDCVEHFPICLKVSEVPDVKISGISCSKQGIVFLADSGRGVVYRLDLNDGTCFNFGRETLGK